LVLEPAARQNPNLPAGTDEAAVGDASLAKHRKNCQAAHKMSCRDTVPAQVDATIRQNPAQESGRRAIHSSLLNAPKGVSHPQLISKTGFGYRLRGPAGPWIREDFFI
jgi:hypothetical protein